jgi:predicted trehalose synthase
VPGETIKWLGGQLATAIEKARGDLATRVTLSAPARELWKETLYDEFTGTDDTDEVWTQFIRRAAPYCLRIAALHAVLAGRNSISIEDLAAAGGLVRYSIASARYVLDRRVGDPRLDRIRRAVIARPDGLTRSAVSALFSRTSLATCWTNCWTS